jgi:ATP-dependent helicase/nuclease subunit A
MKGKGRRLDYQDLELLALELLTKTGRDITSKARHILLDELQDTNPVQWEIVQAFTSGGARLFCVGDVKQSIYAFRGAHAHIVQDAKDRLKVKEEVLVESYRSLPAIVDFVNLFFRALMEDRRDGGSWNVPFEKLECMRKGVPAGTVTVHIAGLADAADEPGDMEANGIAQYVKSAVGSERPLQVFDKDNNMWHAARYRDIAILARTKTNLPKIEEALRAAGVPFWISKGVGFYERQEVRDVWNLFKALDDPQDDVALALVLRSPVFGLSDEALLRLATGSGRTFWDKLCLAARRNQSIPEGTQTLSNSGGESTPPGPASDNGEVPFEQGDARAIATAVGILEYHRMRLDRASISRIIGDILDETGAWGAYASSIRGCQVTGNIRKLLADIRDFEGDVSPLTQDVLEHMSTNIEVGIREGEAAPEEAQNAVQLMTVHAAKGLEFPIVCLADAGHGFNLSQRSQFEIDPRLGIGVRLRLQGGKRENSTGLGAIKEEIRQSTLAEEKRLFYVAATRARDHLFISGKSPTGTLLSYFHWLLGVPEPVGGLELTKNENILRVRVGSNELSIPIHVPSKVGGKLEPVAEAISQWRRVREAEKFLVTQSLPPALRRPQSPLRQVPGLRLTAGDLVTFEECPRKYDLRHRHGIPEWTLFHKGSDPEAEALRTAALHAQKMGLLIHRIFEQLPRIDAHHIDTLITSLCLEFQVPAASYAPKLREMVKKALESPLKSLLLKEEDTAMEDRFTIREGPHVVDGVIDRVSFDGGDATILDFKTVQVVEDGKIRPDRMRKAVDRSTPQLGLYSRAVKRAHRVSKVRSYLLFTDCPEQPQEVDPGADVGVEKIIEGIADSCRSGVFNVPDRPGQSKLCHECGFWQLRICRSD